MALTTSAAWLDSLSEDWASEPRDPSISPASNKSSGSIQVHDVSTDNGNSLRADQGQGQAVPDQLPSTMRISKDLGRETDDWKRKKIMDDITRGEEGPVKDLFSPMGLENLFQPPRSQTSSPTKLRQIQLGPSGTPPRHQLTGVKGSMIPLPISLIAAAPVRTSLPTRVSSPRPQTKTSQISTPQRAASEVPDTSNTPITSPLHGHGYDKGSLSKGGGDSFEIFSGFKPAATSTLREPALIAPLNPLQPNWVRSGKQKVYTTGDTKDASLPVNEIKKENQRPGAFVIVKNDEGPATGEQAQKTQSSSQIERAERPGDVLLIQEYETIDGPVGSGPITTVSKTPSSQSLPHNTSEYPSSPPWLTSQSPQLTPEPITSGSVVEQEGVEDQGEEDEEEILPPNELNARLAQGLGMQEGMAPRPLPEIPILSSPPPKIVRAPLQPISSPDDPFASHPLPHPRLSNPPRTPSPKKNNPPLPPPTGSSLKLFAGIYDTFTTNKLVRRISQFEGRNVSSMDESKDISEPNSSQLYGSNPEVSVIEPAGTPLIHERPFQVIEDSQISLRRPRQRTGSSSSLPNDGIHGPRSPLKERTPKRIRRSWSGNFSGSRLTREQNLGAEAGSQQSAQKPNAKPHHARRSSAPSPSPHPRNSLVDTTPPLEVAAPLEHSLPVEQTKQATTKNSINGKNVVFGCSGEGSLIGTEFQGLGIGSDMLNKNRKGSVNTQDFLAQAEEVMLRIRAAKGEQSWFSDGTTGLESFLSGCELSLSAEQYQIMKERLLQAAPEPMCTTSTQRLNTIQTRPGTSILVNLPEQQRHPSSQQEEAGTQEDGSGTTRRYPPSSHGQQGVLDALCAAVVNDRHVTAAKTHTAQSKPSQVPMQEENLDSPPQRKRAGSIASNSSRSDIRSIQPAQIEHLLPLSIGSMTFDPIKKAWIRTRSHWRSPSPPGRSEGKSDGSLISKDYLKERLRHPDDAMEDDPFQGISDLSVDEELEARLLMEATRMREMITELEEYVIAESDEETEYEYTSTKVVRRIKREEIRREIREELAIEGQEEEQENTQDWDQARRVGGDESSESITGEQHEESSWITEENDTVLHRERPHSSNGSVSNHSAFTDSRTETRSTSWGDSVGERRGEHPKMEAPMSQLSLMESSRMEFRDDDDSNIQDAHIEEEGDVYVQQQRSSGDRAVDYSSPSVSTLTRLSRNSKSGKRVDWVPDESDITMDSSAFHNSSLSQASARSFRVIASRNANYAKRLSSGGRSFIGRPISRINEEDENEIEGERDGESLENLSSALTPASSKGKEHPISKPVPPPATIQKPNVSFHFSSPLPEFSYQFETTRDLLNLELSYVAQRHGGVGGKGNRKSIEYSFSVAQENLVRHLTDVEPFEPYWEYMKFLKLHDRKILTIHGLHEWCPRIEELDVSDNEIGQVSGVPNSVRNLRILNNRLSSLTAWGHLTNLQYLDISGNNLDSLAGLRHMFHLRELRADDNQITQLDEIMHLDGLCSLSVKKNKLKAIDFDKASLTRLTYLDLKENGLESVKRLENLSSLSSLCLDLNSVATLGIPPGRKLVTFRVLKLCGNKFESFDLSTFPNLRTLYMDDNPLAKIHGLRKAKHLDGLSLREQRTGHDRVRNDTLPFEDMFEVRKIYASGNAICTLNLDLDFLNLQYLELAGVQLTTLQANFGHLVSNVRVLNLNYNAISDLRPLFGIIRLKKLLLVGNRIRSMRKLAAILECFPSLSFLDLRTNPLTLGFYPPALERATMGNTRSDALSSEPFSLAAADEKKDRIFQSRLDMETALLRRRYEIVLSERCPRMKNLDGLPFHKADVFRKDTVYDELRKIGLIRCAPEQSAEPKASIDGRTLDGQLLARAAAPFASSSSQSKQVKPL